MAEPIEVTFYGYNNWDGELKSSNGTYSVARAGNDIEREAEDDNMMVGQSHVYGTPFPPNPPYHFYFIWRGFLFFDTSEIPTNAVIVSATLRLHDSGYISNPPTVNFDLVIQKFPDWTGFSIDDWGEENYEGDGGSLNTSSWVSDYWNEIELNEDGLNMILKGEITSLSLRSSKDISSTAPTANPSSDYISIFTQEAEEGYRPELIVTYTMMGIENIKAEPDSTQGAIKLYGEITEGGNITEKGFEYIIQDEEPSPEDTGIEVIKTKPAYQEYWDIGEYWAYEYEGNEVAFGDRLYRLSRDEEYEHTTIWWFRAYFKIGEDKYTADSWMKNVPTVTTSECTEVGAQQAKGNGELTDKGANIVERLGFRIIKEYSGDLMGAQFYCNILSGFKVAEELEEHTLYDTEGIYITGYYWAGIFYRDAFFPKSQTPGDFELGIYSYVLGGGLLGEELGIYLKPNDTLKIQAIAKNDLGIGYGADDDIVTVNTSQNFLFEEDEPVISPTSVEKTVTIRDIPEGSVATRVGIRLGRTTGCNEIDVFMDGEWGNEEKVTFFITDLVPGKKYYEEPYMVLKHTDIDPETEEEVEWEEEIIDDEEEEFEMEELEDEDLDDIIPTYEEYNYKTIIREIGCEKISDQSFIDKAGRRRSGTITNHLIQDRATCQTVIVDYLNKFQTIKLKVEIEYDIPIPFERQDSILIDDGVTSFKANGEGEILFKEDGEGESPMATTILAKIRKIDSNFISGSESIFNLELEV